MRIILAVFVCLLTTSSAAAQGEGVFDLREVRTLGSDMDLDVSPDQIFGLIRGVIVDDEGRIYVGDRLSMTIKVFENDGSFLRSFGSRGKGPGEFSSLETFFFDSHGNIVVVNYRERRLVVFTKDGAPMSTIDISRQGINTPRWITPLGGNELLFYYKASESLELLAAQDYLLHRMNSDYSEVLQNFGSRAEMQSQFDDDWVNPMLRFAGGSHLALDANTLLYAPTYYDGTIFLFERMESGFRLTKRIVGIHQSELSFERIYEPPFPPSAKILNGPNGSMAAMVNTESVGLFRLNSGHLIHFSIQRDQKDKQRYPFYEIFSPDGVLQNHGRLSYQTTAKIELDSAFKVSYKDKDDRFYFVDYGSPHIVRVMEPVDEE